VLLDAFAAELHEASLPHINGLTKHLDTSGCKQNRSSRPWSSKKGPRDGAPWLEAGKL
jgi:hypothetical protein